MCGVSSFLKPKRPLLLVDAVAFVITGAALALLFVDLAHLATVCGAIFAALVAISVVYVLGGACLLLANSRGGSDGRGGAKMTTAVCL